MNEKFSAHERCKFFLNNSYDNNTKLMSLLFIRNELSFLQQTSDILYLEDLITKMVDTLVDH